MPEENRSEEKIEQRDLELVTELREVFEIVKNKPTVGIFSDIWLGSKKPNYAIFYNKELFQEFEELVKMREDILDISGDDLSVAHKIEKIVGNDLDDYYLIYKEGEWIVPPESLIISEDVAKRDESDLKWFEEQREHFAGYEQDEGGYALEAQSRRMQEDAEGYDEDDKP